MDQRCRPKSERRTKRMYHCRTGNGQETEGCSVGTGHVQAPTPGETTLPLTRKGKRCGATDVAIASGISSWTYRKGGLDKKEGVVLSYPCHSPRPVWLRMEGQFSSTALFFFQSFSRRTTDEEGQHPEDFCQFFLRDPGRRRQPRQPDHRRRPPPLSGTGRGGGAGN